MMYVHSSAYYNHNIRTNVLEIIDAVYFCYNPIIVQMGIQICHDEV